MLKNYRSGGNLFHAHSPRFVNINMICWRKIKLFIVIALTAHSRPVVTIRAHTFGFENELIESTRFFHSSVFIYFFFCFRCRRIILHRNGRTFSCTPDALVGRQTTSIVWLSVYDSTPDRTILYFGPDRRTPTVPRFPVVVQKETVRWIFSSRSLCVLDDAVAEHAGPRKKSPQYPVLRQFLVFPRSWTPKINHFFPSRFFYLSLSIFLRSRHSEKRPPPVRRLASDRISVTLKTNINRGLMPRKPATDIADYRAPYWGKKKIIKITARDTRKRLSLFYYYYTYAPVAV